jgi:hypothetical protein
MNYTTLKICLLVLLEIQNPSLKQYPICANKDKISKEKIFLPQTISVFFCNTTKQNTCRLKFKISALHYDANSLWLSLTHVSKTKVYESVFR